MSDKKATKTNWIAWGLAVVIGYVGVFLWLLGPQSIWTFFHGNTQLNTVGDFLAGIFAFPAFVLLAAAVLTQRQELNETRDQFNKGQGVIDAQMRQIERQNTIALSAARANYKVQVHDKRMIAYQRLLDVEFAIITDGDVTQETRKLIHRCAADAKFVFGDVVNNWIATFIEEARELRRLVYALEALERTLERQGIVPGSRQEWNDALVAIHEKQQWFFDNLTMERVDEVLGESLRLPEDIE
ncbi:hypothetical protein M2267_001042 [Ensifer sp. KUDG1]|uniref:hypothetical protein n=1 Tax=Ensifer sp. KUDG1 TaxID=3373919 RepID=UPI003D1D3C45